MNTRTLLDDETFWNEFPGKMYNNQFRESIVEFLLLYARFTLCGGQYEKVHRIFHRQLYVVDTGICSAI
jgi:hypothetical protein